MDGRECEVRGLRRLLRKHRLSRPLCVTGMSRLRPPPRERLLARRRRRRDGQRRRGPLMLARKVDDRPLNADASMRDKLPLSRMRDCLGRGGRNMAKLLAMSLEKLSPALVLDRGVEQGMDLRVSGLTLANARWRRRLRRRLAPAWISEVPDTPGLDATADDRTPSRRAPSRPSVRARQARRHRRHGEPAAGTEAGQETQ